MAYINKDASVQLPDEYTDIGANGFKRINDLRKKNRSLKTLIAIQETVTDNEKKNKNNKIFFDPVLRGKLVNNVVNFVQKYKFNGIQLESAYISQYDAVASDKQNFVLLLKELKEKFDKNGLILALAVDARESTAKKYDIKEISKYVSFINLETYNFHRDIFNDEKVLKAGHIAPLYHSSKENTEDRKLNIDYIVKYWLSQEAPPNKLILGTTFTGIIYTLANPKQVGRDAPVVDTVKYTLDTTGYGFFCPNEKDRIWKQLYDKEQQVPYMYKGKRMIAYDNVASIKTKAEYAKSMKLGGVFVDSIEQDDFLGQCDGEKSPLLKAVNRVLRNKSFASGSTPPEELSAKHPVGRPVHNNKCHKIVGCYYVNNENEQPVETLNIEMIDLSLCTHLFYSMASLQRNASVQVTDEYTDIGANGAFQRISNLRKKNRRLKTLIAMEESVWEDDSKRIQNKIMFDPNLREKLVNNVVKFVQKYKFSGIELHSQYLAENNAVSSDKRNFVLLLKALKKKFDKNGLIISLAVDARESTAKKYNIKGLSKYVTFINLRTYNFHGDKTYDGKNIVKAGHSAPLYHSPKENTEERKLNVNFVVQLWIAQHAPPGKLILGTTVVGLEYNLTNPTNFGRDAPVVEDPKYVLPTISYIDVCPKEKNRVWTTFWDEEQEVPYIHKGKDMIAYDNVNSIRMKAEYANKMKLGGVFLERIDEDDFSGQCGGGKFPLLRAVNQVLRAKC
ncbi:probable chitinase 10 [Belonocnema kinseyi]|uniref:probable chitinase 10 n=1 Tax=Belonocnema kinseyi TaxID=2817044 RepID=UPI00143D9728|nr:probable chitinase 10 [Belonocnema kinseyi]